MTSKKETNGINVTVFNMITNKNEAKTCDWIANANSIAQNVFQIKNRIMKHVNVNVKVIVHTNKL